MAELEITAAVRPALQRVPAQVLDLKGIRRLERQWLARTAPGELMAAAGRAVATVALRLWQRLPASAPVILLVGPGNNGGDALVAGRLLRQAGLDVQAAVFPGLEDTPPEAEDAREAWLDWQEDGGAFNPLDGVTDWLDERVLSDGRSSALVIDGLFGIGLTRPLQGALADLADYLRAVRVPVLAIDAPSGLDADTGAPVGDGAVLSATHTVTMIADKPGLHTGAGLLHAGHVWVAPLCETDEDAWQTAMELDGAGSLLTSPTVWHALPRRSRDAHKGQAGDVVVLGGRLGMAGAARLAARGALGAGAGRVWIATEPVEAPERWSDDPNEDDTWAALRLLEDAVQEMGVHAAASAVADDRADGGHHGAARDDRAARHHAAAGYSTDDDQQPGADDSAWDDAFWSLDGDDGDEDEAWSFGDDEADEGQEEWRSARNALPEVQRIVARFSRYLPITARRSALMARLVEQAVARHVAQEEKALSAQSEGDEDDEDLRGHAAGTQASGTFQAFDVRGGDAGARGRPDDEWTHWQAGFRDGDAGDDEVDGRGAEPAGDDPLGAHGPRDDADFPAWGRMASPAMPTETPPRGDAPAQPVDPQQPEVMGWSWSALQLPGTEPVLVLGCGLGQDFGAWQWFAQALASGAPVVIDADGLGLLARHEAGLATRNREQAIVLTPHPLEAARLLATDVLKVQADRVGSARTLAARFDAVVVLKGAGTVVAAPDGFYAINTSGHPVLGAAGTGDVLAGTIGALLAACLRGGLEPDEAAWQAACAGVWLHGRAGEWLARRQGPLGIPASRLPATYPRILRTRARAC